MVARKRCLAALVTLILVPQSVGVAPEEESVMREDASEGSTRLQAIRAAGEAIRPLHVGKVRPEPGDWLAQHREPGQTFDAYRASDPNRPAGRRTTLYLQPLGDFDAVQERLLAATAEMLERFYGVPVQMLDRLGLDAIPAEARRVHPTWGDRQVLTSDALDLLKRKRPEDAVALLALTTSDLWPGAGWNFVFGQASLQERVGIWSLYRQGDPHAEYSTCLLRTLKTAVHETGHLLGLWHCMAYECGMNGSNHRAEADARPLWFCPEDEMKVWWACRVEPKSRYERLAAFAGAQGLDREARFWRVSLAALEGTSPRKPLAR
jgi:archaemetzincin